MHFPVRSDTKLTGLVWPMWLMAVASLPFVAMLTGGALLMLYAAPRKRLQAQLVVRNCGSWPGVPRALWFGAKQGLRRWPYLLAGVLVVGATIGTVGDNSASNDRSRAFIRAIQCALAWTRSM